MLSSGDLEAAVRSMSGQLRRGGVFVASIRDYDSLLAEKPAWTAPYIHRTEQGQRVSLQTWRWEGDLYRFTQYILDDGPSLEAHRFEGVYRAVRREELTSLLLGCGCRDVIWSFPEQTGWYQPIVTAAV